MAKKRTAIPGVSKYQRFKVERVHRSQLNPAPYNPRQIDPHARAKLKESIKSGEEGLVETLVWNRRTGNLVSGHQRLDILDELEGKQDYSLDVSVLDVAENVEKRLNIKLNNIGLQGDYDLDPLAELLAGMAKDGEDIKKTGFDALDLAELFPDRDFAELFPESEEVKKDAKTIEEMKAEKKRVKNVGAAEDEATFTLHLVGDSADHCRRFLTAVGLPDHAALFGTEVNADYIELERIAQALRLDLTPAAEPAAEPANEEQSESGDAEPPPRRRKKKKPSPDGALSDANPAVP